jgi:hypothetical protein
LVDAVDAASRYHEPCRRFIEGCRRQATVWYVTWGICYEFLRVATHARVLRRPFTATQAWSFIEGLLRSPAIAILVPTERHAAVATEVIAGMPRLAGDLVFDAKTAILMREHGVRTIYTRDMDFHRFPFVEVVDPSA